MQSAAAEVVAAVTSSKVTTLLLAHNAIGKVTMARMVPDLCATCIEVLDLSNNALGDTGLRSLLDGLKQPCGLRHSLERLTLRDNNLSDRVITELMAFVREQGVITKLDISWNLVGKRGCVAIGECLRENATLRELNLAFNAIHDDHLDPIAKALSTNVALVRLDLSFNHLHAPSAYVLYQSLLSNPTLQELLVNGCKLGTLGVRYILRIVHNVSMVSVGLVGCSSTHSGGDAACYDDHKPEGHYVLDLLKLYGQYAAESLRQYAADGVGEWRSARLGGAPYTVGSGPIRIPPPKKTRGVAQPAAKRGILELTFLARTVLPRIFVSLLGSDCAYLSDRV
jgi:hypothetical protein